MGNERNEGADVLFNGGSFADGGGIKEENRGRFHVVRRFHARGVSCVCIKSVSTLINGIDIFDVLDFEFSQINSEYVNCWVFFPFQV